MTQEEIKMIQLKFLTRPGTNIGEIILAELTTRQSCNQTHANTVLWSYLQIQPPTGWIKARRFQLFGSVCCSTGEQGENISQLHRNKFKDKNKMQDGES